MTPAGALDGSPGCDMTSWVGATSVEDEGLGNVIGINFTLGGATLVDDDTTPLVESEKILIIDIYS